MGGFPGLVGARVSGHAEQVRPDGERDQARSPTAFPAVPGRTLLGAEVVLPADFPADRTLAVVAFQRGQQSRVDRWIERAVAASCAVPLVWPPVTVGARRFIDGGIRSAANADLASGFDRIVIVAPQARGGGPIPGPRSQADALRAQGARVVLVTPDADSVAAIGSNVLDPSRRAPSAHAGREQARSEATEISAVWS